MFYICNITGHRIHCSPSRLISSADQEYHVQPGLIAFHEVLLMHQDLFPVSSMTLRFISFQSHYPFYFLHYCHNFIIFFYHNDTFLCRKGRLKLLTWVGLWKILLQETLDLWMLFVESALQHVWCIEAALSWCHFLKLCKVNCYKKLDKKFSN